MTKTLWQITYEDASGPTAMGSTPRNAYVIANKMSKAVEHVEARGKVTAVMVLSENVEYVE